MEPDSHSFPTLITKLSGVVYMGSPCDVIALDVPLVLAGGLFYHVLLVLVLARLKLLCYSLFRLSITLHGVRSGIDEP